MPYQVIVGEKNLAQGKVEIKVRRTGERIFVERERLLEYGRSKVGD
jgi:prolyl-tRNA synthetase